VRQQRLTGRRELYRAWTTRAFKQPHVHDSFEVGDLLANRRLGVMQLLGGSTETARVGHRH
jgi:hypothetical protein